MCGIVAVIHADQSSAAAVEIHDCLYILQHRGQDACGIVTCAPGGRVFQCKGTGLASKVFRDGERVEELHGFMGLGHLRYPTAATTKDSSSEAQPLFVNAPYGICFATNGNLTNATELRHFLDRVAFRHVNTESDSELMLNVFASELNETGKSRVNDDDIFDALGRMYQRCVGGWAGIAMIAGFGILGFRDPWGVRPIVVGERQAAKKQGTDFMMASESVALELCGYTDFRDLLPGEAVIIQKNKRPVFRQVVPQKAYAPDIFEYVYFARPDTVMDGIGIDESRRNMGFNLAKTIQRELGDLLKTVDFVIPIPETAVCSASCVAEALSLPYVQGFVKSRYIFRTFIMPSQTQRRKGIWRKLSPIKSYFAGRNVLLIDDSIVRGNTSSQIVQMAREAGAKKVYLASCAPPVTNTHIHGIDLSTNSELIAFNRDINAISKAIAADAVIFQTLPDLISACASLSPRDPATQTFEVGVFGGGYVTPVSDGYFEHLERLRGKRKERLEDKERSCAGHVMSRQADGANGDVGNVVVEKGVASGGADGVLDSENGESEGATAQDISLHNLHDHERA